MERHGRLRRTGALAAFSAALVVSAIAPSLASGQGAVGDVLKGLGLGGGPAPQQNEDETGYQPPLHGKNPHGQGTVGTVDVLPNSELPYSGDPAGGEGCPDPTDCEEVVIGRSRGEQESDGTYHGHVTILSLFGNEFPPGGVDTGPDGSESFSPLGVFFGPLCAGSGGVLCLGALEANSATTQNSSENSFEFFRLNSESQFGHAGFSLFRSEGNIEEDQNCQRSEGSSSAARFSGGQNGDVSSGPESRQTNGGFELRVLSSSAESEACNNSAPTQTNDSSVFTLGFGDGFTFSECEGETLFGGFPLAFICNADDKNGEGEAVDQAPVPYGVREAFNVFLFPLFLIPDSAASERGIDGNALALIKATVAASESHTVAPPAQTPPTTTPGSGTVAGAVAGQPGAGPGGQGGEEGGGPVANEAGPGTGELAFTGSDVLILALIGAALVMAGLTATRLAVRHRRPAA